MIFRIFIICFIILAAFYYSSIILQCLFPESFKITNKEIKFIRAIIPFYYWISNDKKNNSNSLNNKQLKNQEK
jgi:hypothetical protein